MGPPRPPSHLSESQSSLAIETGPALRTRSGVPHPGRTQKATVSTKLLLPTYPPPLYLHPTRGCFQFSALESARGCFQFSAFTSPVPGASRTEASQTHPCPQ